VRLIDRLARIFLPPHEKAFPTGWQDVLIKAAVHRDHDTALESARSWLANNDIETAAIVSHRPLVSVAARFSAELATDQVYRRLVGIQRKHWTLSRLALGETLPSLHRLEKAGVDFALVNGAEYQSWDENASRVVPALEIEIVVRREQSARALDTLFSDGWAANRGESEPYLCEHADAISRIGLWRGSQGDIVLRPRPYGPGHGSDEDDRDFWLRATPAEIERLSILIPGNEDGLALAIEQSAIDGHHGDWPIDCAANLAGGRIRWDVFEAIVSRRRLAAPAAIALHYLADELGHDVPDDVLRRLTESSHAMPAAHRDAVFLARTGDRVSAFGRFAAAVARRNRRHAERRLTRRPDRRLNARRIGRSRPTPTSTQPVTRYRFDIPAADRGGTGLELRAVVCLAVPKTRKRVEFEINGSHVHLCRIRYRTWTGRKQVLVLEIKGNLTLPDEEPALVLESRPIGGGRGLDDPGSMERYGPLPFRVVSLEVRRNAASATANSD